MKNHCYSSTIQLNDSGISSLLHHKYEEATGLFHQAIEVMKEDVCKLDQLHSEALEDMLCENVDIEFYQPSRTHDKFRPRSEFKDPVICKMAISVLSGALATSGNPGKSLTTIVIYNLAITTHLWALETGSTELLRKALRIYEIVYRAYRTDGNVVGLTGISVVTNTLNNVASIYVAMGNHELAGTILHPLLAILTCCCTPGLPTTKYGPSFRICWGNVVAFMVGPPTTAGAA